MIDKKQISDSCIYNIKRLLFFFLLKQTLYCKSSKIVNVGDTIPIIVYLLSLIMFAAIINRNKKYSKAGTLLYFLFPKLLP